MNEPAHKPLSFDGHDLRTIKRRFFAINRERLRRVRDGLRDRQQCFLELLPLLIHINHPMLPGYLSAATPAGISDYAPTRRAIAAGRRLSKSFTYRKRALRRHDILAVYLMGSTGTIAHSRSSDLDIWLCTRPDLGEAERALLQEKVTGIEHWASGLGLEVHFFLMNDEAFRAGEVQQLSRESSGTAQYHLLLDEFYRTGLLIAGRYPIWWLVPPEYETDYDAYVRGLLHKRFVARHEVLDFGGLADLPAGEFLGAALWQIYKGVSSPYKSVLKILLMEAYAAEYPATELLSLQHKRLIHAGETRLDVLDPYVQMYRRVEHYLRAHGEQERLELARRCFYFKAGEYMSRPDRRGQERWQRELLASILEEWGWTPPLLASLDGRWNWKIDRVAEERRRLVAALTRSYDLVAEFARTHAREFRIDPGELNLLGRRLYAAFQRKAGKVDLVNPGISGDLSEERLSLHFHNGSDQGSWSLYRGEVEPEQVENERPLRRTRRLLELLGWCHFNRVVGPLGSVIRIHPSHKISSWEVRSVLDCLQQIFPRGRVEEPDMDDLARPARLQQAAIFINLGLDPMAPLTREGMHLVSERTDSFRYGGRWENLALTFDQIATTSWGEVLTTGYAGEDALPECLTDYLSWFPLSEGERPPTCATFSFSSARAGSIAQRVQEVMEDMARFFYDEPGGEQGRYLLQVGHRYYLFEVENDVPRYRRIDSFSRLLRELGRPRDGYGPLRADPCSLSDSCLPLLFAANRPDRIQLFYQVRGDQAQVYILDERGSLFWQETEFHDQATLLTQFQRFLEQVRRHQDAPVPAGPGLGYEIEYYQVYCRSEGGWAMEPQQLRPFQQGRYLPLQVIGEEDARGRPVFTLYCDDQEFSTLEHGDQLFAVVARHVLQRRQSGQAYPIYITDIDLARGLLGGEAARGTQTIHFLDYKKRIEARLNAYLEQKS